MRRTRSWRTTSCSLKVTRAMPSTPCRMRMASTSPDFWPGGRSICDRVAGDDHPRAFAEAGQKHLHLHRGGVLRLVEQNQGVRQRAPAHEGERRDLDHARLQAPVHVPRLHEIVERIVDRAKIGIDLLAHVAGQEAEALAGLHRGTGDDQAVDLALFQERHRIADREPGLAGAGGAFARRRARSA